MNRDEIAAIRERADKATPGPWVAADDDETTLAIDAPNVGLFAWLDAEKHYEDAEFIAHARSDVPALLDEIDRLTAENNPARAGCPYRGWGHSQWTLTIALGQIWPTMAKSRQEPR